jgi:hypothetical protein
VTFERISGHRNGNKTECPGNALYAQLGHLRTLAAQYATIGLSVVAPREIIGLKPVEVSGFLRFPDGSSPAGHPIALEFAPAGAAWQPLGSVYTGDDGSWKTSVQLTQSGRLRAVYPGDSARGRMESAIRNVTVLPQITTTVSRKQLRLRSSVQVKGTAVPTDTVRLTLDRWFRRRWRRERLRTLRVRNGGFKVRLRPRSRGRYRVMVQKGRIKRRRYFRVF